MKYVGKEHALHLKQTLEKDYTVTKEWDGIVLSFNFANRVGTFATALLRAGKDLKVFFW